jgi:hypothetical protein
MSSPSLSAAVSQRRTESDPEMELDLLPPGHPPLVWQDAVCMDWSLEELVKIRYNKVMDEIAGLKYTCIRECDNEYDIVDLHLWDSSPAYWLLSVNFSEASREMADKFMSHYWADIDLN